MRARFLGLALVSIGCFSDAPDVQEQGCPVGSKGCPCTSGGACDNGLECHAPSQNCYDPECDEGSAMCPCFQGMCFSDLQCIEGYCNPPHGEESDSGGMSTVAPETGSMTADADSSTTNATQGDSESGAPTQMDCDMCFAALAMSECNGEFAACNGGGGCSAVYACVTAAQNPFEACCGQVGDGTELWNALATCLSDGPCAEICAPFTTTC